jgi:hypothetical protein
MKPINTLFMVLMLWGAPRGLLAQQFAPIMEGMTRTEAVISKLCETTPAFTAVFQFQIFDTQGTARMQMTMDLFKTKEKMRTDLLVSSISQIPTEQRAAMQAAKMDKISFILRKDMKKTFLIFSGLEAFQEFPTTQDILDMSGERSQSVILRKTEVGPETINGHSCVKTLVEVLETNRPPEKAYVWYASDLRGFPVRILMSRNNLVEMLDFKNVRLAAPDATAFEIPDAYVRLEKTEDVFRVAKERLQQTNAPSKPEAPKESTDQ